MEKPSNPYDLSASTLKALARFGPDNPYIAPKSKLELMPLPATDWELWTHMPKATLAETVAVSLGIDPSATKPGSGYVEPGKEYDRRLKIACAYVSHAGPLKSLDALPPMHMLYGPATATVSLPQFAEWALSMGWTLPEKFPRWKVAPVKTVTQTPAPAQSPAPPAPVASVAIGGVDQTPDTERRLALLRALGGGAKYARGEWRFTGIAALVAREKDDGRKRCDEKTIRADLKEAAQAEREAKSAGLFDGLGKR